MASLITVDSKSKIISHSCLPDGVVSGVASSDTTTMSCSSRKRKAEHHQLQLTPASPSPSAMKESSSTTTAATANALQRMLKEEQLSRSCQDYNALLETSASTTNANMIVRSHLWRERVAKWFYDVLDYLEESRDVAYVAMNFFDRYFAVQLKESSLLAGDLHPFEFEVMAFTSLFLAVRVCGVNKDLKIPDLLQLSSSMALQTSHILATGHHMLEKLSWNHRILTPHAFLKEYLNLLMVTTGFSSHPMQHQQIDLSQEQGLALLDFACYLMEVSLCDSFFTTVAPSQVALGALVVAITCDATLVSHRSLLVSFFRTLGECSSINIESAHMKQVISRLLDVYNHSHEANDSSSPTSQNTNNNGTSSPAHTKNQGSSNSTSKVMHSPHLILDDDEEEEPTRKNSSRMLVPTFAEGFIADDLRSISPSSSLNLLRGSDMVRMTE